MGPHFLNHLFAPQSIVVIGASETPNTVGTVVFRNLLGDGFKGELYPVNPKHDEVQNKKSFSQIGDISHKVDLAIIATPAHSVPDIIRQCGRCYRNPGAGGVDSDRVCGPGLRRRGHRLSQQTHGPDGSRSNSVKPLVDGAHDGVHIR